MAAKTRRPKRRRKATPRAHLVLRLRKGWRYDARARCFRKQGCDPVRPRPDLPRYTRIQLQVPTLARKRRLTAAEDALARSLQVVPPRGSRLQTLLARVEAWPCVEKAWVAAEPTAPGAGPSAPR
jgi:hypothetical protein